ncbi:E3 ubiquitin-protein ligase TRIM39-like [Mixophyes fleayi]|uniref:E3 ubiquitin-protein ligase TRIM39-like n=1 Tax=Mixophyes fleayi TaxID=3061075 RepID=UPI003F4E1E13
MASADLRDELNCSICLNIYTDPVTLRCGHNFCRVCIDLVLNTQQRFGVYTCPDCREGFQERPVLRKNTTLCNIAECFLSTHPEQEETLIFCTNCIHSPVPAVKTCLMCEASLCDNHLRVHSKSEEHVLVEPTTALGNRKCPVHKKILEYYCTEDATYICVSCRLDGEHRAHKVTLVKDASDKKKKKLRNVLEKLTSKSEEIEKGLQSLQECRREVQEKAAGESKRVTALFTDIRKRLEDVEKRVLNEISRQENQISLSVCQLIKKVEMQKEELSRKMYHIEKLCNMTDPLIVLQESDTCDLCDMDYGENEDKRDTKVHDVGDLDQGLISETLHTGLSDFVTWLKRKPNMQEAQDILLDMNTACEDIDISGDLKAISRSEIKQYHPERFQYYPQVLSSNSFSAGRHNWEVETSESGNWKIGMCYPSVDRSGDLSYFGDNNKSWCLRRYNNNQYSVVHDSKEIQLTHKFSCQRLRIYLDYEAGQLSFYELCDPIRHLHTFTATFTEPLHAAFCVWDDWVRILQ